MTKQQIEDNLRALRVLRRCYTSRTPYAYLMRNNRNLYDNSCPLCEKFRLTDPEVRCSGCVWREMGVPHLTPEVRGTMHACRRWGYHIFVGLKRHDDGSEGALRARLAFMDEQVAWLEAQR